MTTQNVLAVTNPYYRRDSFSRLDESDDGLFYTTDRFVHHLDAIALATAEQLIGELVVENRPKILDLMAGWDSHLPSTLSPAHVVGLGLNYNELARNEALNALVIHDMNKKPQLPFADESFDVVLNTVSVDYLTKPFEIFAEVGRILTPGGLFLVIFSNRMFEQKATKIWREGTEDERVMMVEDFLEQAGVFDKPEIFVSKGKTRPPDDKYAPLGLASDPVYAVYAEKSGRRPSRRPQPSASLLSTEVQKPEVLQRNMAQVKDTRRCPHCSTPLRKWQVPANPFVEWDAEFMYICFDDQCPYFMRGWNAMYRDGGRGLSHRFMYDAIHDRCLSIPVLTINALKDGIVDE